MSKDISNNIEYFATNTKQELSSTESFVVKYYKHIAGVYFLIAIIITAIYYTDITEDEPDTSFLSKIIRSTLKGFFFPIVFFLFILGLIVSGGGTNIGGITVPNSSFIGSTDFISKTPSNKEKMTNIDKPNNQSINTATTISQTSQINNNQSNIIPQKSLIDIPKKSISNTISPSTKENISSFKSDAKALLSKTMNTIKSSNSPNVSSNKPVVPVKNLSSNRPMENVKNVQPTRSPIVKSQGNISQPTRSPIVKSQDNIRQSTRNVSLKKINALPNKTPIAIPVNNNIGGGNDDDILNNIIMVGGICILSYILYMLYNEIVMLIKIKKDIDEKNKRHNKLILTSNNIL
jgi:hypothetical protein